MVDVVQMVTGRQRCDSSWSMSRAPCVGRFSLEYGFAAFAAGGLLVHSCQLCCIKQTFDQVRSSTPDLLKMPFRNPERLTSHYMSAMLRRLMIDSLSQAEDEVTIFHQVSVVFDGLPTGQSASPSYCVRL